ncbi:hypothetical protein HMPREF2141_00163 [Bacteroides uniformis]|uniref:Uncharacterized protein n=1 Tax=Bacteroides uniformis (strain ATCC 8492 / DSM 6597 / CCUG 4942 / CIP 103695 / JCM 5828 / KCTC 5204 / NCTC 13054 / VPI 0061) TaxID=411479 RepID=A0ABC9NH34_BACUC|nr:hypothetical protein BACUNI_00292 [Bacteroides uniformis ATCC 8492]KXT39051.1 hypothetical protein HMPREF2141_00163 [Bacteroides uniformis]
MLVFNGTINKKEFQHGQHAGTLFPIFLCKDSLLYNACQA